MPKTNYSSKETLKRDITLIAGPTASGKSALALDIAAERGGVIINADSMQVYNVLRVLTARPDIEETSFAPHYLYGYVDPTHSYSTGQWLEDVKVTLSQLEPDRPLIFAGGTGLYFRALLGGLSPMPEIPDDIRNGWRKRLLGKGAMALHAELQKRDPDIADLLNASDGQRIARALEVLDATGKSISFWQRQKGESLINASNAQKLVLIPDRDKLKERIAMRFDHMMANGALEEVKALRLRKVCHAMPVMKAIGVRYLCDYLDEKISLQEAIILSKTATRQYAKRQMTWFRNQFGGEWQRLN